VTHASRLWPSLGHGDAVLGGIKGARWRLRRPCRRLRAALSGI